MSVGDSITCERNNCVDEEIKTVSPRHAEALSKLSSSTCSCYRPRLVVKLITQKLLSGLFSHI